MRNGTSFKCHGEFYNVYSSSLSVDAAPSGSLMSRESFKGCLRNVAIGDGVRRDWTDMDGLYNVLLGECLTIK